MRLRRLNKEDAPLMYEWMLVDFVVHDLAANFADKKLSDCESFIDDAIKQYTAMDSCKHLHMAIADDNDEYMGTVSLRNIDRDHGRAEFAITVRRAAMGQGFAGYAMKEIIKLGFEDPDFMLNDIYWCVNKKNTRARRFYDKNGFTVTEPNEYMEAAYKSILGDTELIWYEVSKEG